MSSSVRKLLDQYRGASKTEREKGTYFERLAIVFLQRDPGMAQEYENAQDYATWARERGLPATDNGVDVVAKIRGEESYCAVQCKFYREGGNIPKAELDKFLSTLGAMGRHFSRGLIIETTGRPFSSNATALFDDLNVTTLGLDRLEESPIDWEAFFVDGEIKLDPPKQLMPHQREALRDVKAGLSDAERGKLIMACGTGKTFTGLKIAEDMVGIGGKVLVLMPSLALVNQTIREWTIDSQTPLRSYAVCSDAQVGKRKRGGQEDVAEVELHDLDYPATTNAARLASRSSYDASDRMTVVFSTYQSIQVISDAQKLHGFPDFDLIICDEAHRTTGATLAGEDESAFVKIHNQDFIAARKRLYMTATPRVFGEAVKAKASEASAELASMDDETLYGEELFVRGFGWAVENQLLTDYKVIVLAVDEEMVSASVQNRLKDADSSLVLDDATKIIGCYKALIKSGLSQEVLTDPQPMQRAIAFCKDIASSKLIQTEFRNVVEEYLASEEGQEALGDAAVLTTELQHVDGTMGAKERANKLDWLKESHGDVICRILSNARCLSEGVDVPALDTILFMHPRKSQIDVVQSVGRVMRRTPGKNMGYVILPIGVPAGMTPEEALADNERYRVVWQILNALRSHDERFDAQLNQADLGVDISHKIEVVAVSNKLPTRSTTKPTTGIGSGSEGGGEEGPEGGDSTPKPQNPFQTGFVFDEFSKAIMAKIVKKCGRRDYWENWAGDIAKIAEAHISRITGIIAKEGSKEREAFDAFLAEIRDDLNPEVSEAEAIEMLAQHLITRPVFDALFEGYDFTANNPVSRAMQSVLEALDEHRLDKEAESLDRFYASVQRRAQGIDNAEAKQKIVVELYDKFFRNAFPRMTERLGIVYTPVEVVDFIIHSVNEVLQSEFGQTLGSKGVHILDPFTGTGTFITRLLQSGLIKPDELEHKYRHEIHANEIVLLAYYIAAINIEAVYHSQSGGDYAPFEGICLTDTFQMGEQQEDLLSEIFPVNSDRRTRQMELPVKVIVGNPPYSVGQGSANDNAANLAYPKLDQRIRETYSARSDATNKNALYDSYIRAIRWASDRIGDAGVVAYVSNAGWIDGNTTDGLRQCLAEEFASIHVFHLRGNARTSGEQRRKEKDNVFGQGTRTPVAITLLVKNSNAPGHGRINFHDIGDYLSQEDKLKTIANFGSIGGISNVNGWQNITPDEHGDWLGQRDRAFDAFLPMGDKSGTEPIVLFDNHSSGLKTQRDTWAFNSSRLALTKNMHAMIGFYNQELERFDAAHLGADRSAREKAIDGFIDTDPGKISWTDSVKQGLAKGKKLAFELEALTPSLYRPFTPQWLYYSRTFNERVYQMPRIFPMGAAAKNRTIQTNAKYGGNGFIAMMSDVLPDLHCNGDSQCFPRYLYDEEAQASDDDLFASGEAAGLKRRDALTDQGLTHFQAAYPAETITKDDLFYYVYGLLHSEEYRDRFADNLSKELPRIPAVKQAKDFWAFVEAGRELGNLHCDYEAVEPYPVTFAEGALELAHIPDPEKFYRVEKMKFHKVRNKEGKLEPDKTTVIYNSNVTITGIPLEAYDYVVNGKAALDWVMERQCVKTDKASGIVNDANRFAIETAGDPAYPLKLFQRVITVSLETMKIVRSLPNLEID